MKRRNVFFIIALVTILFTGCKYDYILPDYVPPIDNGGNPISFSTQVAPIFSTGDKCTQCHKPGGTSPDLTAANAYSQLMSQFVNTSNPAQSIILTMPGSSAHSWKKFTATEAQTILQWITEGAQNN